MLKRMFISGNFRYALAFLTSVTLSTLGFPCVDFVRANPKLDQPQEQDKSPDKIKFGEVRSLPTLQTRARPPLLPKALHIGMKEIQFFEYAKENNWAAVTSIHRTRNVSHILQPGGEGVYALPNLDLVYARGFTANVYFESGRLVGMHLINDPRDRSLTAADLITLVRAWFPDDVMSVLYQVLPTDPQQRITETLIGKIPEDFRQDFGQTKLPFCRVVTFPAPIPITSIASC